jgi:uncharacterized protein
MNSTLGYPALALLMRLRGSRRTVVRSVAFLCSLVLLGAGCKSHSGRGTENGSAHPSAVAQEVDAPRSGQIVPRIDHHQHLLSPALAEVLEEPEPLGAELLIQRLDEAGIQGAVVLSLAYVWGSPLLTRKPDDEYRAVRAENDWTAEQVAMYPDRLTAFCSVNPLADYALAEIDRCAADPRLRNGLKMQFGNSMVNLRVAEHVAQLRRVFAAANQHQMPIVAHVWTGNDEVANPFDGRDARTFINEVLPMSPDVTVQIAHMGGSGPRLDPGTEEAMLALAEAASRGEAAMKNVYFDIATNIHPRSPVEWVEFMTARMREIGMSRLLYGSDLAIGDNALPAEYWRALRDRSGLTSSELETIAGNVAPYIRK